MKIKHIKATELTTNKWSGGTTTQLAIYPKDAEYKERNFLFRISTATVETEESVFTKLPGVSRKLMILDGEIKIEHKNHYTKILKKFDQDEFSGDGETKSYGKATDFNVMTTGNTSGTIESWQLKTDEKLVVENNKKSDFIVIYVYTGCIKLNADVIEKGDVLIIDADKTIKPFSIESLSTSEIIITRISLKIRMG
ncbi:MAG: HutD family protein [Bacteroidales bacterium]